MKVRVITGLVMVSFLATAPVAVHAQLGGMLRRKADDLIKGKPAAPATPAKPSTPTGSDAPAPAPTASGSSTRAADKAPAKPTDPLDPDGLELNQKANAVLRGGIDREGSDWDGLPYIPQATLKAARGLDDAARVAFVQKLGAAFKAIVMSDTYKTAHAAYVASDKHGVDHGLKGLVSYGDLLKASKYPQAEVLSKRESAWVITDNARTMSERDIRMSIEDDLKGWQRRASDPARKDRAKYQKFVTDGNAVLALLPGDIEKARRGWAVLTSADQDNFATEAELYAAADRHKAEQEQLAYDAWNLNAQLKSSLQAFVAVASTVDFAAQTKVVGDSTVFVSPALEKKGVVWKACFRAGKASTQAALAFAQEWLKEL